MLNKLEYVYNVLVHFLKLPIQIIISYVTKRSAIDIESPGLKYLENLNLKVIMSYDYTKAYYSNNLTFDGVSHDTDNMFKNTCLYLLVADMSTDAKECLLRWVFMNTHGGNTLTNGTSWPSVEDYKTMFHSSNVNLETLAALNLLMTKNSTANRLLDNYENLFLKIKDNGYQLNYATDPGGKLSAKFLSKLQEVGYNNLKVQLPNKNTYMGLNGSADSAVLFLASIKIMEKVVDDAAYTKMFNLYNNVYGYKFKIKNCSNSFVAISSLFVLYKLTKSDKYLQMINQRIKTADMKTYFLSEMKKSDEK